MTEKEFEQKLKKLRIKTRFMYNLKHVKFDPHGEPIKTISNLFKLQKQLWGDIVPPPTFKHLIANSFIWADTKEGLVYWLIVSEN